MRSLGTIKLNKSKTKWIIDAEPHVVLRMKRVFGKLSRRASGKLQIENTHENCRDLEWFIDRYPMTIESPEALADGSAKYRERILLLEQIIDEGYTPRDFTLAIPARDYQKRAAEVFVTQGYLLLADDVGIGKTASAICSFCDSRTLPAVVVTLSGTMPMQWKDEINKFAPALDVHVLEKGTPYELPKFFGRGPDVIILNYHKLAGWSSVLKKYAKTVIYDEIQELRRRGKPSISQKYAAAIELSNSVEFRLGLSATPFYNYGGEMFNVCEALQPGLLGSRREFDQEWCSGYGMDEKTKIKDPKAFGTYLRENFIMLRRTRTDVGREIQDVTKIPHRIGSDARKLDEVNGSAGKLAKIILAEGGSGHDKLIAGGELSYLLRQATGIAKAPYVADFVRLLIEAGEPVVLAGWHREVYEIWKAKLKDLNPMMFTGSESPKQKREAFSAFCDGKTDILMMSLRAGAGVDGLQYRCRTVVYGELDWSPGIHEQFTGRIHRDGQEHPVAAYFLVADSGSDPVIAETLGIKRAQIDGVRNPEIDLMEKLDTDTSRARKLAEYFLDKSGDRNAKS